MKAMTIVVAGATGLLGNEVCRQLVAKKFIVKAMVRENTNPTKIELLSQLGVQVFQSDLRDK